MALDDKTIGEILLGPELARVENEIGRLTNQCVIRDHLNFTIGILKRDLTNSGLGLETVLEIVIDESEKLIEFAVEFLLDDRSKKHEEELAAVEEPNDVDEGVVVSSEGLGFGFALQYAIRYHFLKAGKIAHLTDFLKKNRIPHPQKFARKLQEIYVSLKLR